MKIVTANLLRDGRVAYLASDGGWAEDIADAALFDDAAGETALADAAKRTGEVADIYLIEASEAAAPEGRAALRETIRSAGPTVREDLGKQAGNT